MLSERIYSMCIGMHECCRYVQYFKHKDVQNYIWYRHKEDRVNKSITDMFLVRKNKISSEHHVWSRRVLEGCLLDHMVVIYGTVYSSLGLIYAIKFFLNIFLSM